MIFSLRPSIATLVVFASAAVFAAPSHASVTAYFSNGTTCNSTASKAAATQSFAARDSLQVSLCVTTTIESLCGSTLRLAVETPGESGHFQVTGRTLGKSYPEPNNETLPATISIDSAKLSRLDFGGTSDNPQAPAADQLLATFTLTAQGIAKNPSYTIHLDKNSVVSVAKGKICDPTVVVPISASLTLNRK